MCSLFLICFVLATVLLFLLKSIVADSLVLYEAVFITVSNKVEIEAFHSQMPITSLGRKVLLTPMLPAELTSWTLSSVLISGLGFEPLGFEFRKNCTYGK